MKSAIAVVLFIAWLILLFSYVPAKSLLVSLGLPVEGAAFLTIAGLLVVGGAGIALGMSAWRARLSSSA